MTHNTTEAPSLFQNTPKVGDFMISSWGYDQTNVDFYKVVGVTAKSVKIQRWTSTHTDEGVIPGEGPRMVQDWSAVDRHADYWTQQEQKTEAPAKVETKRVKYWGEKYAVSISSFANAYHWQGTPAYVTPAGYGH